MLLIELFSKCLYENYFDSFYHMVLANKIETGSYEQSGNLWKI